MNDIDPTDFEFSFSSFVNKYKAIPGIIYIEKDEGCYNTIFVGIDKERITEEQLPIEYQLLRVSIVDAYDALEAYEVMLDMVMSEPDTKEWQKVLRGDIEFLAAKLEEYENR